MRNTGLVSRIMRFENIPDKVGREKSKNKVKAQL